MDTLQTDPLWVRDYNQAFEDLLSGPELLLPGMGSTLLLPAPESTRIKPEYIYAVPIPPPVNLRELRGSALRAAIASRMHIFKTANPYIREVHLEGQKVGELARSPFHAFLWLSSADRRMPFTSMTDAAVFTVAEHLGVERVKP
jgi:hypothetical protein